MELLQREHRPLWHSGGPRILNLKFGSRRHPKKIVLAAGYSAEAGRWLALRGLRSIHPR
jgi:hypothetical protein